MKLSIADMLNESAAKQAKDWGGHDRSNTIGASEIGHCLRQLFYSKNGLAPDAEYVSSRGAMDRGNIIESAYWEPGLRGALPEGVTLLYAGKDQRTLVDGFVSATPDGLLAGVSRDCLAHLGVDDTGSDEILAECKSIDPRVSLDEAKSEHVFQVQMQLGLVRYATNHKPNVAVVSYINASFLDDIKEFAVVFDPAVYAAGKARAMRIYAAGDALELPPEGKIAGGKECGYCAWAGQCAGATYRGVPQERAPLTEGELAELSLLVLAERDGARRSKAIEKAHGEAQERIKEFLRARNTSHARDANWSVGYTTIAGRTSYDFDQMREDGLDIDHYAKHGQPSTRLTVKIS